MGLFIHPSWLFLPFSPKSLTLPQRRARRHSADVCLATETVFFSPPIDFMLFKRSTPLQISLRRNQITALCADIFKFAPHALRWALSKESITFDQPRYAVFRKLQSSKIINSNYTAEWFGEWNGMGTGRLELERMCLEGNAIEHQGPKIKKNN